MTTPDIGAPSVNFGNPGGAAGTLGTGVLQQSVDALTNAVNNLYTRIGSLSFGNAPANAQAGQGGGPTRVFPGVVNPFNNNPNQPGIGGGGPGGAGNVPAPNPFGAGGRVSSIGAFMGAFAGYGQQQLPVQLALNAYATQTAMAQGQLSSNFSMQYRQAFGYQNQNLNFMASSPLDAIAGTQGLQYLAGNPTFMGTPMGRAGFGYAAAFANANPLASMQQSVSFAQQMANPQMSLMMMSMGYPVTPRRLGGGANLPGNVIQGMLRAWYGQKDVNPNTLTAGLGLGGRANLNLQALGINPSQAAPLFSEYNDLFRAGLSPAQAQALINQSKSGNLSTAKAAQVQLASFGVKTATSSAQAMRNNQAVLTERAANIASGFSRGLQDATGLLSQFNNALTNIMTTLNLNGITGWAGGFGGILAGTNHGNSLLGLGGSIGLGMGISRLLGLGGGAGGAGGLGGGLGGAGGMAGAGGFAAAGGAFAGGAVLGLGLKYLNDKLTSGLNPTGKAVAGWAGSTNVAGTGAYTSGLIGWLASLFSGVGPAGNLPNIPAHAGGGIIPGYSPGRDNQLALVSGGEAILNPDATRALGVWNIHNLNSKYRRTGAKSGGGAYGAGGVVPSGGNMMYRNPFRSVSGLTPERVDMGVDYAGSGPVYAIGPGIVTNTSNSWLGAQGAPYPGTFLSYRLTAGPDRGKYVYVAEDIWPSVRKGQSVNSNTIIGRMRGGIETGWAAPPGTGNTMAAVTGETPSSGDPGAVATAYGVNFNQLLKSIGAPPGIVNGAISGNLPSGALGSSSSASGAGQTTTGVSFGGSGVGYSEAGMIPTFSEISALGGGMMMGSPGATLGSGTNMNVGGSSSHGGPGGSSNAPGGNPAQNIAIGRQLAAKFGWATGTNWDSLYKLWMGESGWDRFAYNASGATGIPQALPHNKMPKAAWLPSQGGQANAGAQETWGMQYIKGRYQNPANAYKQWLSRSPHWYGEGGTVTDNIAIVGEKGPELLVGAKGSNVINNDRTRKMLGGPHVTLNFGKESVVIRVDHAGSDASSSGRNIARQFIKWLEDESMYNSIRMGDKNG